MTVTDRFLKYVTFDTESSETTGVTPSTPGQRVFAEALVKELEEIGLEDITLDDKSYLMATLPANTDKAIPVIGFIAHLDTSPDMSGKDVQPRIVDYQGGDIVLCAEENVVLSPAMFPELNDYKGQDLIVTNGKTLLGADDKGGVAAIIAAMKYLKDHPEIEHGKIRIGFTPDEEIGAGADYFDVEKFGAEWAYTIDGGQIGELEYENFNAAGAKVLFKGLNVHPGYAKDKMLNASLLAVEFASWLPVAQRPEHTTGYEGFFHLTSMSGTVEEASLSYISTRPCACRFRTEERAAARTGEAYERDASGQHHARNTRPVLQYARSGRTEAVHRRFGVRCHEGRWCRAFGKADPRRYGRRSPFFHGTALPEYLRRRVEFPRTL